MLRMDLVYPTWDAELPSDPGTLRAVRLAEERTLTAGEVVAFLPGPLRTHQLLNRAAEPARVLIIATNELPEIAEQPENEQMAILTAEGLRLVPLASPVTTPPESRDQ